MNLGDNWGWIGNILSREDLWKKIKMKISKKTEIFTFCKKIANAFYENWQKKLKSFEKNQEEIKFKVQTVSTVKFENFQQYLISKKINMRF